MYTANDLLTPLAEINSSAAGRLRKELPCASTAEIRAMLCDLRMRPYSHRRMLCRLLRSAAAQAEGKVSVVHPVESHHNTTS